MAGNVTAHGAWPSLVQIVFNRSELQAMVEAHRVICESLCRGALEMMPLLLHNDLALKPNVP